MKKIISYILSIVVISSMFVVGMIESQAANVSIKYSAHIQNIGWQAWKSNGTTAGTTGQAKRLEAIKIKVSGLNSGTVKYRTHIQNKGWQGWKSSGSVSGTEGKSLRVEAIQIKLTGKYLSKYDVLYRAHVQGFGWLAWTKNGNTAGTTGMSYRMEAIQIKLAKKGSVKTSGKAHITTPTVSYSSHVQNIGWQVWKSNGATAGTTGQAKRMEAIKISCNNLSGVGCINYSAHVQDIGWQGWVSSGKVAGTTGKSKRMEAIKIKLNNTMSPYFNVYYRVHISNYGWLAWTKNGAIAGSTGISTPIEAIQIKVLSNADTSISTAGTAYIQNTGKSSVSTSSIQAVLNKYGYLTGKYWTMYDNAYGGGDYASCGATVQTINSELYASNNPATTVSPGYKSYNFNNSWQCHGFALYVMSKVTGNSVSSAGGTNWSVLRTRPASLQVGDIIRASGHTAIVLTNNNGNCTFAECWGGVNSKINIGGGFNPASNTNYTTLDQIVNKCNFEFILRYNG